MKRPRRRKARENAVILAIDIYSEVELLYGKSKHLSKHNIHKQTKNVYNKVFFNIVEYLDELRGHHKNPISCLLKDYFVFVFERFSKYKRKPSLFNFSPSSANKIQFEEWIDETERKSQNAYWVDEIPEMGEIIEVPYPNGDDDPVFAEV